MSCDDDYDEVVDISDLFTNKDYSITDVSIPCYGKDRILNISIASSIAASTDHDLTGQIIWPCSVLLSYFLASKLGQECVKNKNVLELGAGTGLPGLVSAHFANQLVLTDGNDIVLDLLQQNCNTFLYTHDEKSIPPDGLAKVSVCKFVWGDKSHLLNVRKKIHPVDVVIAADVIQWPAVIEPFLHSVKALLWNSRCVEPPKCILGLVHRAKNTIELFLKLSKELGFSCQKIHASSFMNDGEIPKECQEHGGRKTEIYEVILISRQNLPILLDENNSEQNLTVGKTFENTLCMPY